MIFFRHTEISANVIKFEAVENDYISGFCVLDLGSKNAAVTEVEFASDKLYIVEGLLKAAFNFAASKNFYIGECHCENISNLLTGLGFIKTENIYSLDIPSILMGSCCKK